MSLQSTKEHLVQLLADPDNKVIALSGKWGTGKSHLWQEVKDSSADPAVRGALYVSLFGLRDINQVKSKVAQKALPRADKHSAAWEQFRIGVEGLKKVAAAFHRGFSALDDLALLIVPSILKNKTIVLDDIERKHENLSNDEVLGFIDEFTQQHGCRFILIMNSDQLVRREVWDTLREKVVDQEIRLDTSSSEAFEIAARLTRSTYEKQIRKAVETCGLTNIRIIRKVIKAVNRILGGRNNLSDSVLSRVVPSTVLLATIHYKGIDDGPDFDFVLAQGTPADWNIIGEEKEEQDEGSKRKSKWKLLLSELGIHSCDEYETFVIEFLQSGLFDTRAVSAIIDRYVAEDDATSAREEAHQFLERSLWNHELSEDDLLREANALAQKAHLLDPYTITDVEKALIDLPNGTEIGRTMVDAWIAAFRAKNMKEIGDDNPFNRPLHPLIRAEFDKIKARGQAKTTVLDACLYMAKHSGWGTRQQMAMKAASVADFELVIRTASTEDLKTFMRRMLELRLNKEAYESHFGEAMDRFTEACRNIAQDPRSGRLTKLIKRLFASAKLESLLDT